MKKVSHHNRRLTCVYMASPKGFEPPERPGNAPVAHSQRGQRALSALAGRTGNNWEKVASPKGFEPFEREENAPVARF